MKKILFIILILFGMNVCYANTLPPPRPSGTPPQAGGEGYHVNKNFDIVPNDKKSNSKVVLITIDDGPTKQSNSILETLAKHNAKAIFFVNGVHNKDNPNTMAEILKAGHSLGNHTWDHPNLKKLSEEKIKKEIESDTELIKKLTNETPKFFRPPFGVSTKYVRDLVKKDGMIYMNWSGAAKDWEKSAHQKETFIKNVMKDLHPGSNILIHEHPWSAQNLDALLTNIEQKGYTFVDPKDITK